MERFLLLNRLHLTWKISTSQRRAGSKCTRNENTLVMHSPGNETSKNGQNENLELPPKCNSKRQWNTGIGANNVFFFRANKDGRTYGLHQQPETTIFGTRPGQTAKRKIFALVHFLAKEGEGDRNKTVRKLQTSPWLNRSSWCGAEPGSMANI